MSEHWTTCPEHPDMIIAHIGAVCRICLLTEQLARSTARVEELERARNNATSVIGALDVGEEVKEALMAIWMEVTEAAEERIKELEDKLKV